jgi:hypothetical protein
VQNGFTSNSSSTAITSPSTDTSHDHINEFDGDVPNQKQLAMEAAARRESELVKSRARASSDNTSSAGSNTHSHLASNSPHFGGRGAETTGQIYMSKQSGLVSSGQKVSPSVRGTKDCTFRS